MKIKNSFLPVWALAVSLLFTACHDDVEVTPEPTPEPADMVITGNIYVGDDAQTYAEALAIKDGKIVFCGTEKDAQAYIGASTTVQALKANQLVVPGMIDAHTHAAVCWDSQLNAAQIPFGVSQDSCLHVIADYVKANPNKAYYKARGWIGSAFDNQCPTAKLLDELLVDGKPIDKPILATSSDGHSVWCNTAMMELAGIDASTEAPAGGTIEKYKDGTPNGCFRDNATVLPQRALPDPTAEDMIDPIKSAQDEYSSLGYTAYNESMINESSNLYLVPKLEAYEQLDKAGALKTYVQGAFILSNRDDVFDLLDLAIKFKESTQGGDFEVTDVKIFMDGVVEGGTAYLSEPYANDSTYYGASSWSTAADLERLTEIIVKANTAGLTVHFHAIGDQASMNAISCVEKAKQQIGDKVNACRNVITHLQIVNSGSYQKMKDLGIVANLNPWCCKEPGFYEETEVAMLGPVRAANEYPIKTFLDKGVNCSFGTDYGSSFTYLPGSCLSVLVNRTSPNGGMETQLNPSECITPQQALGLMTSGSAWQLHQEDNFGTLEVGKYANLVVLNQNIMTIQTTDLANTTADKVMYKGKWTK